jgi:hypothetical protein
VAIVSRGEARNLRMSPTSGRASRIPIGRASRTIAVDQAMPV